ncbi:unnamed protein product [Ilex paraguariensis]
MAGKSCELCKAPARMYCESDQASLCWDCDAKVHSANFLVARHSRSLLCHACQSPTPWNASGPKIGSAVSVCDSCVDNSDEMKGRHRESTDERQVENPLINAEGDEYDDEYGSGGDDEEEELGGDDDEDEDGDNQVVPWSSTPPPPSASSSDYEESNNSDGVVSLKRGCENVADLLSDDDDDLGCSSSQRNSHTAPSSSAALPAAASADGENNAALVDSWSSTRPLKIRKLESARLNRVHDGRTGWKPAAIMESLRRFNGQGMNPICGDLRSPMAE